MGSPWAEGSTFQPERGSPCPDLAGRGSGRKSQGLGLRRRNSQGPISRQKAKRAASGHPKGRVWGLLLKLGPVCGSLCDRRVVQYHISDFYLPMPPAWLGMMVDSGLLQ